MDNLRALHDDPFDSPFDHADERRGREDWEDWEDEEPSTPLGVPKEEPLIQMASEGPSKSKNRVRRSEVRQASRLYSVQTPSRLKSRGRQKAQNAKAGIKLVTDMTKFRKKQHIAYQLKPGAEAGDRRTGKFVDAAALRALEGKPSDDSVGSWHWLKRKPTNVRKNKSPKKERQPEPDLSPADRPIVIGIALPEDDLDGRVISPETATLGTPVDLSQYLPQRKPSQKPASPSPLTPQAQQRSVWSPDTEDGSPFRAFRAASSVYSQHSTFTARGDAPPVPALPTSYKNRQRAISVEDEDDDNGTPVTLFEEDGSPVYTRKSSRSKGHARSPATVGTRSGWWDHVQTPFIEQSANPFAQKPKSPEVERPEPGDGWWKGVDGKKAAAKPRNPGLGISTAAANTIPQASQSSPTIASSSRSTPGQAERQPESQSEKARILAEENQNQSPTEQPPPYEPPSKQQAIRYRAVFPPGHPLRAHFPPSPGPVSPGLANTMTSQGAISMTDVPLTRSAPISAQATGEERLPDRLPGTFVPADHFATVVGSSPATKIERKRRRHEKEDAIARRMEGFWKGRGCIPENGCYGRRGREGRKRRRICLGIIAGSLVALILIVVLVVTLVHKNVPAPEPYSFWLNLTDFPPIPTGITTVVGPDNTEYVTGCIQPLTLWSCELPKEEQQANEPYRPEQPKFILQIQYDNNTRQLWNVPDGPTPSPSISSTRTSTLISSNSTPTTTAQNTGQDIGIKTKVRRAADPTQLFDPGLTPSPTPPAFHEYYFLGNTTDLYVKSDRKAGEPTPFYISFLRTLNDSVGPSMLSRRQGIGNGIIPVDGNLTSIAPPPELEPDGTGAPARMRPYPVQQPLRLFDRGLPTEHFGFSTFFDKTIYVKSKDPLDNETTQVGEVPADKNGGALESEAKFVMTWTQTRFFVQIWTRMDSSAKLKGSGSNGLDVVQGSNDTMPGTFPYPITIREDNHGGDFNKKGTYTRPIDDRGKVVDEPVLKLTQIQFQGSVINSQGDPSFGGVFGGTGGCKCAWQNFVGLNSGKSGSGDANTGDGV